MSAKRPIVDSNGNFYDSVAAGAKAVLIQPLRISQACLETSQRLYKIVARRQWAFVDDHPETWPLHPVEAVKPESVPKPLIVPRN